MIKTIFIDLDGTTVDWLSAMTMCADKDMSIYDGSEHMTGDESYKFRTGLLSKEVLDSVHSQIDFWINLKKFSWSDALIHKLLPKYQVAFLSKPSKFPASAYGKMVWQQRHYPYVPLVLCEDKGLVAAADKYLIDDDPRQCQSFVTNGGYCFEFGNQLALSKYTIIEMNNYLSNIVQRIEEIP